MSSQDHESSTGKTRTYSTIALGVLASIIASVLYSVFASPVLSFINLVVSSIITPFYRGFVDGQYQQAALGPTNALVFQIFFMLSVAFLVLTFITSFTGIAVSLKGLRKKDIITSSNRVSSNKSETTSSYTRKSRLMLIAGPILISIVLPATLIEVSSAFICIQAYASFDIRLRALAPFVTDEESKKLVGAWAVIRSRKDYEMINRTIDELARKYGAQVPAPLI